MPNAFDALAKEDSDEDDEKEAHDIPAYEDLSLARIDEETVLKTLYDSDFSRKEGPWGSVVFCVNVRPPDIEPDRIGSQFTLNTQVGKKYPYVPPKLQFDNVKGLSSKEQSDLMKMLNGRCKELAEFGSVVVCELVEVAENFLWKINKDPTMSAYDEMRAREEKEREIELEKEKKLHSFMNVTEEHSPSKRTVDSKPHITFDIVAVQKEIDRQRAALKKAYEDPDDQDENVDKEDVDFIDGFDMSLSGDVGGTYDAFQIDESKDRFVSSSRYRSDFVEIKQIGKGGGGTVFKVQNRLDRRIYAVKKVKLLSEQGKMKLIGKRENSKLRREVTTISGMTHRHIVRYYQAWVEEGDKRGEETTGADEESSSASGNHEQSSESPPIEDESSDSEESRGIWGHQPMSSFHDSDESWSSESDTENKSNDEDITLVNSSTSNSKVNDNSSLMKEFGFEHHSYSDLFKRERIESIASSDDLGGFQSSILDQSGSQTSKGSSSILYIQMEYCATTLRQLIDERKLGGLGQNECWKMIRQTLEALDYMHERKVIHRDLKPGNIFLDRDNNIRLGDFGLATTRNQQPTIGSSEPLGSLDDAPEDITDIHDDTITGGVGTTFYIAPEQALRQKRSKGQNDNDMKADIFSLGVVIFEMFFPFSTRMERAQLLKAVRGDGEDINKYSTKDDHTIVDSDKWKEQAIVRFPESFRETAKNELQRLILWCVQRDPCKRPTAKQLLSSDLIPRQIELDSCYLNDVLQTIVNPESESYEQIIHSLFDRHTMHHIEILYDTDDVAKAQELITARRGKNRHVHPRELLAKSLGQIGGFTSGEGVQRVYPSEMNLLSMSAATSTLRRAKGAGKIAKGEVLRNATQQSATVLAMSAATAVAATGRTDGVNGADPRLVKRICDNFTFIFESHGAIPLKPPLLRPKGQIEVPKNHSVKQKKRLDLLSREPSQVLNERGSNLLLPEDLQANFARNIGRGGYALSNVKRYDIDTSYTQSISGGHPRESLEASFDIIIEDHRVSNEYFIAEVIMVACQAFSILSPREEPDFSVNTASTRPTWFLRLSHTRLADAILDICGVSTKESLRSFCYHILTSCSAPPPNLMGSPVCGREKGKKNLKKLNKKKMCEELIGIAKCEHDLSEAAAIRLQAFLDEGCLPLPLDINAAIDALQDGAKKLRSMDDQRQLPRRQKRYEDVVRGLRSIKNCVEALTRMGITLGENVEDSPSCHCPAYISLDLGLRQQNQHYHGQLYFQAIMLAEEPESILNNEALLEGGGKGILMAEGGRYDDLVRKFRPPGNFGASRVDQYTSAPIPVCTGARFIIGAFVERIYVEAALKAKTEREKTTSTSETDILRRLLAIPNLSQKGCVQCIVVSMNGFDSASLPERAMIASRLWSKGISAEYLPQSGVILSLFKHAEYDAQLPDANNVWTLDQICDLCCLLHIPFVVVVQHHLLREKNFVRLRHMIDPSSAHNGMHETFVSIASLASEIKERSASDCSTSIVNRDYTSSIPASPFDKVSQPFHRETSSSPSITRSKTQSANLEYIYVDADQFYLDLDKSSGKDPKLKPLLKMMKKTQLRADPYIEQDLQNVLAVDLPFSIVRQFNSAAMFSKGASIASATIDFLKNHSKYRKTLKTLAMCLDFMLRRQEEDNAEPEKHPLMSVLVYAQPDDRFDLLTLDTCRAKKNGNSNDTTSGHKNARKDRGSRRY